MYNVIIKRNALKLYLDGFSALEISTTLKVSRPTIIKWIKKKPTKENKKEMIVMLKRIGIEPEKREFHIFNEENPFLFEYDKVYQQEMLLGNRMKTVIGIVPSSKEKINVDIFDPEYSTLKECCKNKLL